MKNNNIEQVKDSFCRKTSLFFLHEPDDEFDIALSYSFFIRDHPDDIMSCKIHKL